MQTDRTGGTGRQGRGRRFGGGVVVAMVVAMLAYAALHSPIGVRLDNFLGTAPDCVWRCGPLDTVLVPLTALLLVGVAGLAAWLCVRLIVLRPLERVLAWGMVTYAFMVVPAALLAELGDLIGHALLRAPLGPLLAAVPAAVTIAVLGWRAHREGRLRDLWPRHATLHLPELTPLVALMGLVAVGLMAMAVGVGLTHPPTGYDELGYHLPLAVMFWHQGSLIEPIDRIAKTFAMAQPGSAELWFGLLQLIGGEALAILGQLPFAVLGAVGVAAFGRRAGLSPRTAAIAGLAFLCAPLVIDAVAKDANDIVAASLVIGAAALLAAPAREWSGGRVVLIGLAIGLMAATKLAVLPAAAAILIVLVVIVLRDRVAMTRRQGLAALLVAAGVALLVVSPWWIRNLARFGNPIYPAELPFIGRGVSQVELGSKDLGHVPATWLWPLYPWFEPQLSNSGLGALFAVALIPGLVLAWFNARRRPLAIIGVIALLSLPVWWLATRHEPRFLLGLAGLVFAFLPFVLLAVRRNYQTAVAILLGLTVIGSAALTSVTGLAEDAGAPADRSQFYLKEWHVAPQVLDLPSRTGLLVDDACPGTHGISRIYPLLGEDLDRSLARIGCDATTQEVLAAMKHWKLSEVYVAQDGDKGAIIDARYPADLFNLEYSRTTPPTKRGPGSLFRLYQLTGNLHGPKPQQVPNPSPSPDASPTSAPAASPSPGPTQP